jgi:lipopolysaccharide export system protein LptA
MTSPARLLPGLLLPWLVATLAAETPPQPTELEADRLEMSSTVQETRAILIGNVVLIGTNLKITCDRLEVVAARLDGEDDTLGGFEQFEYLLATGSVRIVQGDREATAGRAEVFPHEDKVVLSEDPVLIDRSSDFIAAGRVITLLRGQRQVFVEQPRLTGPPLSDLGPDAVRPRAPEAPAAPPDA